MATATINFSLPVTRIDGSSLSASEIAHVEILNASFQIGPFEIGSASAVTTYITGILSAGRHEFAVRVVDRNGNASAPSNVAAVIAPMRSP